MAKRDALNKKDVVVGAPAETPWWWINVFAIFNPVLFLLWDLPWIAYRKLRGELLLSKFEAAILEAAYNNWPQEVSEVVRSQISECNFVNRMCYRGSGETILFKQTMFGISFQRREMFPYGADEIVILATVIAKGEGVKVGVDIIAVGGAVYGFEFNRSMDYLHDIEAVEIISVDNDPSPVDDFGISK